MLQVRLVSIVAMAGLSAATLIPALAEDDFAIVGNYTENVPCNSAGPSAMHVKITAIDIDSPILGLCTILEKKREGNRFAVHVECKGAGGASMLGDVTFTMKDDQTIDFADQDNTYRAVLHKCPR
ncbi:MAG: hypothetical protein ACJ8F3_05730 [Xanthobacteraceae bacterium]